MPSLSVAKLTKPLRLGRVMLTVENGVHERHGNSGGDQEEARDAHGEGHGQERQGRVRRQGRVTAKGRRKDFGEDEDKARRALQSGPTSRDQASERGGPGLVKTGGAFNNWSFGASTIRNTFLLMCLKLLRSHVVLAVASHEWLLLFHDTDGDVYA